MMDGKAASRTKLIVEDVELPGIQPRRGCAIVYKMNYVLYALLCLKLRIMIECI